MTVSFAQKKGTIYESLTYTLHSVPLLCGNLTISCDMAKIKHTAMIINSQTLHISLQSKNESYTEVLVLHTMYSIHMQVHYALKKTPTCPT